MKINLNRVRFVNFVFLTHPHFFKALISTLSSCRHGFAVLFYNDLLHRENKSKIDICILQMNNHSCHLKSGMQSPKHNVFK